VLGFTPTLGQSGVATLHQEENIFVNHMFQSKFLIDSNGKIMQKSNLVHRIKKTLLRQKVSSLP
jgi:hypothetical protein